jgi:hypothetical protein
MELLATWNEEWEELDDVRFDEIYEYDNEDEDEDEDEPNLINNKYYIGLAVCEKNNICCYDSYWLFASHVNVKTFYKFPFHDIKIYLNNYKIIGLPTISQLDILQMIFVDSIYNYPVYTVIKKTFWIRLVQRTWKKFYNQTMEFRKKNIIQKLHQREIGVKINYPTWHGMLSYLKDNK